MNIIYTCYWIGNRDDGEVLWIWLICLYSTNRFLLPSTKKNNRWKTETDKGYSEKTRKGRVCVLHNHTDAQWHCLWIAEGYVEYVLIHSQIRSIYRCRISKEIENKTRGGPLSGGHWQSTRNLLSIYKCSPAALFKRILQKPGILICNTQ